MKIECTRCGRQLPCSAMLPLVCGCGYRHRDQSELRQTESPPGLVQQAVLVTKAQARWIAAGRPTRSAEQVAEIQQICAACPLLTNHTCGSCGCNIARKAKLATERCPLQPPKW